MPEKKVIGIALIPSERIDVKVSELATVRIAISDRGEYYFPMEEKEVIDTLLKEILKQQNTSRLSMVFLGIEIPTTTNSPEPEIKARRRRRRRSPGGAA